MNRRRAVGGAAVLAAVAGVLAPLPSRAGGDPPPGRLVYVASTDRGATFHVFTADLDGTAGRLVAGLHAAGRAAASPDGTFAVVPAPVVDDSNGQVGLFVVELATGAVRRITAPRFGDTDPAVSPDGLTVAFRHDAAGNGSASCCSLRLVRVDGTADRPVPGTAGGGEPAWSPDGSRLAYVAPDGLRVVGVDGSGNRLLWSGQARSPAWSPDGSRIAFVQVTGLTTARLLVVPAAGGPARVLADLGGNLDTPTWADATDLYFLGYDGTGWDGRSASAVWRVGLGEPPTRMFATAAQVVFIADVPPQQVPGFAAAAPPAGPVELFERGPAGDELTRTRSGAGWSAWTSLGGRLVGEPAATVPAGGTLAATAVTGTDAAVYVQAQQPGGAWPGRWTRLGGTTPSSPAVAAGGCAGCLVVVARGTDGRLYARRQTLPGPSWAGWQSLGGGVTAQAPALAADAAGRLHLLVVGADGVPYEKVAASDGSWPSSWQSLGGIATAAPAAALDHAGVLHEFVRGTDDRLWTRVPGGRWTSLGGVLSSAPAAAPEPVASPAGGLVVVVLGTGGVAYQRELTGTGWGPWRRSF